MPTIEEADLNQPGDAAEVLNLVDQYSRDPFGDGKPLDRDVSARLIEGLRSHPTTRIFVARQDGEPIGVAVCFEGFSTFAAQKLINVHDLFVAPGGRGQGLGRSLLQHVCQVAESEGCCKVTLEVRSDNTRAQGLYQSLGFRGCKDEQQEMFFWSRYGNA